MDITICDVCKKEVKSFIWEIRIRQRLSKVSIFKKEEQTIYIDVCDDCYKKGLNLKKGIERESKK